MANDHLAPDLRCDFLAGGSDHSWTLAKSKPKGAGPRLSINRTGAFREGFYRVYVSRFRKNHFSRRDRAQHSYKAWADQKYRPLLKGLKQDAPILEVGCGPGYFLESLRDNGFNNATGIDISAEQVDLCLERKLQAVKADVFCFLCRQRENYEAVIAIDFLEHFTRDELDRLIPLVADALRPGGRLILGTPNGQGLFAGQVIHGDLTHMTVFTPQSLAQLLYAHGFNEVRCWEAGPVAKNAIGLVRIAAWRFVRFLGKAARFAETGKRQDIWTETFLCMAYREESAQSCGEPTPR